MSFSYQLFQVKEGLEYRDYCFRRYDEMRKYNLEIKKENYDLMYEGKIEALTHKHALDELYKTFNTEHPKDFKGHPMSIGDVIKLNKITAYCDSTGWKLLKGTESF